MVGHKFVQLVIQGIRMDKVDQYTTKKCQGFTVSLLVPVSMAVLASSLFLRPLLSAASFAHQEHHESVQSEGPYHPKWQGLAGRSCKSDAIFPQLAASGWLGVRGFVLATDFHYESGQQIHQHYNCHIFCGILDTASITPCTKYTDCPLCCLSCLFGYAITDSLV